MPNTNGGLNANTYTKKDQVMWINEKYDLDLFYQYLEDDNPVMVDEFCDMWYNDLQEVKDNGKAQLLEAANGILSYWNVELRVVDVEWDDDCSCFIWNVDEFSN